MNSVLEYLRQLNQQSVNMRDEWLDRLRHVECEPGVFSLSPEICLAKQPALRSSDSSTHSAPITIVSPGRIDAAQPDKTRKASRPADIEATTAASPGDSLESANQSICPPDRSNQSPFGELGTANAAGTNQNNPVLQMKHSPTAEEIDLCDDGPDFFERHSIVPHPHSPKLEKERESLQEHESTSGDYGDTFQPELVTRHHDLPGAHGAECSWNIVGGLAAANQPGSLATCLKTETSDNAHRPDSPDTDTANDGIPSDKNPADELLTSFPRSIDKIVDQLIARFPIVSPAIVMFASLTSGIEVNDVAADVATCLANRDLGKILLIDGNSGSRELSNLMGANGSPGVTELVNRTETLLNVTGSTDNKNLKFLPHGNCDLTHRRFDAIRATELGKELNQAFQYTIVSGGVVDNSVVQRWSGFVDAVYLLINLGCADRQKSIESLTALRRQAVRIAGIITVVE